MPKSAARSRKPPKRRPVPPAVRVARPPVHPLAGLLGGAFVVDEDFGGLPAYDDDDEVADEAADETADDEPTGGGGQGYVRTATLRQGKVPYLLRDVIEARHEVAVAERKLVKKVKAAREHRASWEDVGVAVGMSRQGAAKRFG